MNKEPRKVTGSLYSFFSPRPAEARGRSLKEAGEATRDDRERMGPRVKKDFKQK